MALVRKIHAEMLVHALRREMSFDVYVLGDTKVIDVKVRSAICRRKLVEQYCANVMDNARLYISSVDQDVSVRIIHL